MGRKRRKVTTSQVEEFADPDAEYEEELKGLGLPTRFGGHLSVIDNSLTNSEKVKVRPTRKRKGKGLAVSPHLSEHAVYSEEWIAAELIKQYPRGLNYMLAAGEEEGKEERGTSSHIKFDDEGVPVKESVEELVEVSVDTTDCLTPPPITSIELNDPMEREINQWKKKYYRQRYDLFHRFDEEIQIDDEGWFSVTPERIAVHTAVATFSRHRTGLVWDVFAGVGGNAIQFAISGMHVVATDIDATRITMARHNATVYQVDNYIDFIQGDAMQFRRFWRGTTVETAFISPPWGGPSYTKALTFDLLIMLPINLVALIEMVQVMTRDIILYLPRNTDVTKLAAILPSSCRLLVEQHFLDDRFKVLIIHAGIIKE